MAIGARDYIDQMLVKKYENVQVNNHSENVSHLAVPPDQMLQTMTDFADANRNMLQLQQKLQGICKQVHLQTAYQRI